MGTDKELTISVEKSVLKDFVTSLLGQRRTIEQVFDPTTLFVDYNWITNILDVLEQRMSQHECLLHSLQCKYYYSNGRISSVHDKNSFMSFSDNLMAETVGIDLSVSYLITFPTTSIPENQTVRAQVFSDASVKNFVGRPSGRRAPLLSYHIEFTNITWGEDIASILNRHFEKLLATDTIGKLYCFLKEKLRSATVVVGAMAVLLVGSLVMLMVSGSQNAITINAENVAVRRQVMSMNTNDLTSLNEKLDLFLLRSLHDVAVPLSAANWRMLTILGSLVVIISIGIYLARSGRAYIVACNPFTERLRSSAIERRGIVRWVVIAGFVVSVVASLFASGILGLFQ